MSTTTPTLPYSVSSGSVFSAFDKLQCIKNYANWKPNMHMVLLLLQQWGMVDGTIMWPVLVDRDNGTPNEAALGFPGEVSCLADSNLALDFLPMTFYL